jgi:hypothetical protein
MPQGIGQSMCAVCGKAARPGAAVVLQYGAGGRVHVLGCHAIAQNRLALKNSGRDGANPYPETSDTTQAEGMSRNNFPD